MKKPIHYLCICLLLFCTTTVLSQSARERISLNNDWKFALGHAANPQADFNYGRALSFSKINFLQESTMLLADQELELAIPHTEEFDDSSWQSVQLPHDWAMSLGFDRNQPKIKGYRTIGGRAPEYSVGWYRKTFRQAVRPDRRYALEFEGIFRKRT